jgi:hypothetical protein
MNEPYEYQYSVVTHHYKRSEADSGEWFSNKEEAYKYFQDCMCTIYDIVKFYELNDLLEFYANPDLSKRDDFKERLEETIKEAVE